MNNLAEIYAQAVVENLEKTMAETDVSDVRQVVEAQPAANDEKESGFEWTKGWSALATYSTEESLDAWWSYSESA